MPTGRVKWYDTGKGFGFLTRDDGGDVFVSKAVLPEGVEELKAGQRVDFGMVESRKGSQALGVKLLDTPATMTDLRRRPAEELHGLIEDLIKVLETAVMPDLRRGRYPEKKAARKYAELLHGVAKELES